jgi:acetyltransferase-like isoleucine patch superfamily enzyme
MTKDEIMQLVKGQAGFIGDARNIPSDRQREVEALVWDYNQTRPTDRKRQQELLRQILGTYNDRVFIQHGIHFDFGFNTNFLGMAFVNFNVTILDTSPVTLGDCCFIAPGVVLSCASHPIASEQRAEGLEISKPITIGEGVWIGANATIGGGVTIGDHAVVGAGAVVVRDVPADTVVAGVPARVLRKITPEDRIPQEQIQF